MNQQELIALKDRSLMIQRAARVVLFCSLVCSPAERITVMPYNKNIRKSSTTVKNTNFKTFLMIMKGIAPDFC